MLTIRGERSYEKEFENEFRRVSERSYGSFSRSFALPEMCNLASKPVAKMDDGVLKINVPKREEKGSTSAQAKMIEIS